MFKSVLAYKVLTGVCAVGAIFLTFLTFELLKIEKNPTALFSSFGIFLCIIGSGYFAGMATCSEKGIFDIEEK